MKIHLINSKDHWTHGWLSTPANLETAVNVLQAAGVEVKATEVESPTQLENVLDSIPSDTLVWPNAYFVNDGKDKTVWLNEFIEARNLPYLGSSAQTLQDVFKKERCQLKLDAHNLPIPSFLSITRENVWGIDHLIASNNTQFPVVIKPTAESGSNGICKADNFEEAKKQVLRILKEFPSSDVIIEEFLPSDDITCGYMQLGDEFVLIPTNYIIHSAPGKEHILSVKERDLPWDGIDKLQSPVTDSSILHQLKREVPRIIKALDIRGITRIDGRLDKYNNLRFFDVNGLPGFGFIFEGVMIKQCYSCFPNYSEVEVYKGALHTLVYNAFLQYGFEIPTALREHNFFTMESDFIVKGKHQATSERKENYMGLNVNGLN